MSTDPVQKHNNVICLIIKIHRHYLYIYIYQGLSNFNHPIKIMILINFF